MADEETDKVKEEEEKRKVRESEKRDKDNRIPLSAQFNVPQEEITLKNKDKVKDTFHNKELLVDITNEEFENPTIQPITSPTIKRRRGDKPSSHPIISPSASINETMAKKRKSTLVNTSDKKGQCSQNTPANPSNGNNTNYTTLKYDKLDKGPFVLMLRQDRDVNQNASFPLLIGRFLYKCGIKFKLAEQQSKFMWKIEFESKNDANAALDNEFIKKSHFDIFLPQWIVTRSIVIRGIPLDISENELCEEIKEKNPDLRPVTCQRFKRRIITEDKTEYIDSTTIKVILRNRTIPEAVILWGMRIRTDAFIPGIRQCFRCGKLGHSIKFCKNPAACLNCGQPAHEVPEFQCPYPPMCLNCGGSHKNLDSSCEEVIKRKQIARSMAIDGLSYFAAKRIIETYYKSRPHSTNYHSENNFPPLRQRRETDGPGPGPGPGATQQKSFAQALMGNRSSINSRESLAKDINANTINANKLTGGDFNAHHTSWGNPNNCKEGTNLFNALFDNQLEVLNNEIQNRYKKSYKIYNAKTNWAEIEIQLDKATEDLISVSSDPSLDIQSKYTTFMSIISNCFTDKGYLNSTHGKSNRRNNSNDQISNRKRPNNSNKKNAKLKSAPCTWWNSECDKLIRLRKAATAKLKYDLSTETFLKFKQADAKVKQGLKQIKKNYFITFCESLGRTSNLKFVWQRIRGMSRNFNRKSNANEYNILNSERVSSTIATLCPPWVEVCPPDFNNAHADLFLEEPFYMEELNVVIDASRTDSSPGLDGLGYKIFKLLNQKQRFALLNLINSIFSSGIFPTEWNQFMIFFIPKKDSEKFRPISLAQCSLKLAERLIYNRINWWIERNKILPNSQYGFRNGKSCVDNIALLHTDIALSFENHESVAALFLDVEGAFDNVLSDILIDKLKSIGFPTLILKFVFNLVYKRVNHINFDSINEILHTYKGLPQGSVLSPLLYSLYVLDLDTMVSNFQFLKVLQFADDVCLYVKNCNPMVTVNQLEVGANSIANWFNSIGLSLAPNKSALCIFSKSISTRRRVYHISLHSSQINSQKSVKFLGIHFTNNLKWNTHIEKVCSSCLKPLNILSYLRSTWFGANPSFLLQLYKSLIRSRMDYASFLWNNLPSYLMNDLDRIQFQAIRIALGYQRSTPTNVLLAEAKEPPLSLRFHYLGCNYISKTFSYLNHPLIPLLDLLTNIYDSPIHVKPQSTIPLADCFSKNMHYQHLIHQSDGPTFVDFPLYSLFFTPIVSFTEGQTLAKTNNASNLFSSLFPNQDNSTFYATDGSKTLKKEFGGFAALSNTGIWSHEDSMSVLSALSSNNSYNKKSFLILTIINLTARLEAQGKRVEFYWIPAHKGIQLNESADIKAKNALIQEQNQKKGVKYFKLYFTHTKEPWFKNTTYSRRAISSINRIRASHTSLAPDLFKIKVINSPLCGCKQYEQTINHVFWQCDLYSTQRTSLLALLHSRRLVGPYQIEQFLSQMNPTILDAIVQFINKINLRI